MIEDARFQAAEQMAHGDDAHAILAGLCTAAEKRFADTRVGVTILDRARILFEDAIFPSLDRRYCDALKGIAVADKPGTCALAVHEGITVDCPDVASDPRFSVPWKSLSLEHGLNSLISIPANDRERIPLGTCVISYPAGRPLTDEERELAMEFAELCGWILAYRRLRQEQELMIGEFQHRVRNFFATVGALVYATLKSNPDPHEFRKSLDSRLAALANAHVRAIERHGSELSELLVETLAPYSIDHDISIEGPKILLSERSAMALGLAAHELTTNAAKYGALSQSGGKISIQWTALETDHGGFHLTWQESGGPTVAAPSHVGFGYRTISSSVTSAFDGLAVMQYEPGGMRCTISAPWSERIGRLAH